MFNVLKSEFLCHRIIGWLLATFAMLLLSACSSIRLAYNNGPDLAYWWLNSYVEFDDSQSAQLHTELAQLLAWHRNSELPHSADLLKSLQTLVAAPVAPAQACSAWADIRAHVQPLIARALPLAGSLASSFSPGQLHHLEQRLDKNNQDYRSKWGQDNAAERFERRLQAGVQRYENLYGKLEEAQRTALQTQIAASSYDFERSYAQRRQRQRELLQTLSHIALEKSAAPGDLTTLHVLLESNLGVAAPAGKDPYQERLVQENCATFAAVHNAATPAQRERAVRRLAAYERDARELAGQAR